MTDQELAQMAIPERNAYLDQFAQEVAEQQHEELEARLEWEAERRNEHRLAFPDDGRYAGSPEDVYERYLDSLNY